MPCSVRPEKEIQIVPGLEPVSRTPESTTCAIVYLEHVTEISTKRRPDQIENETKASQMKLSTMSASLTSLTSLTTMTFVALLLTSKDFSKKI